MSQAKRSMLVWTIYVLAIGISLLLIPNVILRIFAVEETTEPWIRVVGVVVIAIGILEVSMVRRQDRNSFMSSVYARWFVAAALCALAILTGPRQLSLFAALELAGSIWTFLALRAAFDGVASAS